MTMDENLKPEYDEHLQGELATLVNGVMKNLAKTMGEIANNIRELFNSIFENLYVPISSVVSE